MAKKQRKKITDKAVDAIASSDGRSVAKTVTAALGYRPLELPKKVASPEVARAVKAGLVRRLIAESAPAAITLMENEVARGLQRQKEGESAGQIALDAAKSLTNLAGIQAVAEDKSIDDMSEEELRARLEEIKRSLARQDAIDVEVHNAPDNAPVEGQDTDTIESLFS